LRDESVVPINGACAAGFERVRDDFESNVTDRDGVRDELLRRDKVQRRPAQCGAADEVYSALGVTRG
jgi:hypothetical protein